jgi:ribosomal-protein-alanine N-acetyltransferase
MLCDAVPAVLTYTAAAPAPPELLSAVASLEAACFERPWGEAGLADTLAQPGVSLVLIPAGLATAGSTAEAVAGYCLGHRTLDELEILQIATQPAKRRRGLSRRLLDAVLTEAAAAGCTAAFLEVRSSNVAARGLYLSAGFAPCGVRRGYYATPSADGTATTWEDALMLRCNLPRQQKSE